MKTITLTLTAANGDELGRLPLPDVALPAAGESGDAPVRPQLMQQMTNLCARIRTAIAAEHLATPLDDIDLQITVSRALLGNPDDGETANNPVVITLPVQETAGPAEGTGATIPTIVGMDPAWDGLFDITPSEDTEEHNV